MFFLFFKSVQFPIMNLILFWIHNVNKFFLMFVLQYSIWNKLKEIDVSFDWIRLFDYESFIFSEFPLWNETWVDRLRRNLLSKYDKFSRPTQHFNTTTVLVYLNIMHVEVVSISNGLHENNWLNNQTGIDWLTYIVILFRIIERTC